VTLSSWKYFIVFLPVTYGLYAVFPRRGRWVFLLGASYVFLWLCSGTLVSYLLMATFVTWAAALGIEHIRQTSKASAPEHESRDERKQRNSRMKARMRAVLAGCILADLGILIVLKYGGFIGGALNGLRDALGLPTLLTFSTSSVALPLGISFYTLQALSYVTDVYRGKYHACKNLGLIALFLGFFPQMEEGPIGRFDLLSDQLCAGNVAHGKRRAYGVQLICWGLFKKLVVADRLNPLVGELFNNHANYQGVMVVLAGLLYTLQLYADFSGIIDVARGSAELFGVTLSLNFRQPFFAHDVNDFWRRWHMTLGSWLRDYVFYPVSLSVPTRKLTNWARNHLSGRAVKLVPATLALLAVWSATGIWHGAAWKYLFYGLYYFAIVLLGLIFEPAFEAFFSKTGIRRDGKLPRCLSVIRTFIFVCIGMILFRANTIEDFTAMMASLFAGLGTSPILDGSWLTHGTDALDMAVIVISAVILLVVDIIRERGISLREVVFGHGVALQWAVGFCLLSATIIFGAYGAGYTVVPSIYAGF
jgi:D-alanyl-lipoteichoic acid acyltransferase DltB (MBOAT superfamily)